MRAHPSINPPARRQAPRGNAPSRVAPRALVPAMMTTHRWTPGRHVVEFESGQAGSYGDALLGLETYRLQGKGVVHAAHQRIGVGADTDRGTSRNAAVIAGEIARADMIRRCEDGPAERRLGRAEVD